jgi:hypothetical protein
MKCDSQASFSACIFVSICLDHEAKVKVMTIDLHPWGQMTFVRVNIGILVEYSIPIETT